MKKIVTICDVEYIVDTEGKIYSTHNNGRGKYHQELHQRLNRDGYYEVTVGKNTHRTTKRVSRIVAETFIENPLNLDEVDHINNIRTDNRVENLRWVTHKENVEKIPFETQSKAKRGSGNGRTTFVEENIIEIRKLYDEGMPIYKIAQKYNSAWSTINNIVKGLTWKHCESFDNHINVSTIERVSDNYRE